MENIINNAKPNYYSIMPASVRYSASLTSTEKLLYSEITSLCDMTGACWAANSYFAKLFNKTEETISRNIKNLEKKELIRIIYKKRGSQIIERGISIVNLPANSNFTIDKNINGTIDENINGTIDKNVKENNIYINNKENINNINIINTKERKKFGEFKNVLLTEDELEKLKKRFPDYLEKIEHLSSYIESSGKKYKSHYATILCWSRPKDSQKSNCQQKSNFQTMMDVIDSL